MRRDDTDACGAIPRHKEEWPVLSDEQIWHESQMLNLDKAADPAQMNRIWNYATHTGRVRLATRQTSPPKARVRSNLELSYLETKGIGTSRPTQMPDGEAEVLAATKQGNTEATQAATGGLIIKETVSSARTETAYG